jgi:transcriptional regulator with XRE-family HTH domain
MRMAKNKKKKFKKTYLKAWRKHRGLTQERLGARLDDMSGANISRIENGHQPYSQEFLEAAGRVLDCTPTDIIERDPNRPENHLWRIIHSKSPKVQRRAVRIIEAIDDDEEARSG